MTPQQFIDKWQNSPLKERAAAQEHFLDLCHLLDEPTPASADPTGQDYGFEVGASKTTGGNGFADVFKRGHFGWEYKGTKANLDTAFVQLQRYAIALDNPPLLIVSDIGTTIRIHTNWTNSVSKVYEIAIADLADPVKRGWLKAALSDPEALRPSKTRQELTEEVAGEFAELARSLRSRGHQPEQVAHFINRLVFCMFAEDVKLLPDNIFARMLERALEDPSEFEGFARSLFAAMKSGGHVGFERVAWFNGGLFDDDLVFALDKKEIGIVHRAAKQFWGDVDPSILGTLFERGLDPDKRSQLGAHYTDRDKIMMIINPVIVEPLTAEWEKARADITALMDKAASSKSGAATKARNQAQTILDAHLKRLGDFRVLDPACGSGNFLYLALRALKDLEHKAQVEAEALGLPRGFPRIGPEVVKGIEINHYAAELARVSVWIGEIQWMLKNGFAAGANPILKPLETIECRDALMTWEPGDGEEGGRWVEAKWPKADAIIGNPPFLGSKFFRKGRRAGKNRPATLGFGDAYTDALFATYKDKVRASADLVAYWFYKVRKQSQNSRSAAFGLIATKSISKGSSNEELQKIHALSDLKLNSVWQNVPWIVDGTQVRVSLICGSKSPTSYTFQGRPVSGINPDLSTGVNVSRAAKLATNAGIALQGVKLNGPFAVPSGEARRLLLLPINPHGFPNTHVVRRFVGNDDVTVRDQDGWVLDFTEFPALEDAALFEEPFRWVEREVHSHRNSISVSTASETERLDKFWLMQRPRPQLRSKIAQLTRVIAVPETSEHLLFRFLPADSVFSGSLFVVCCDSDVIFGIMSSRIHRCWAGAQGNRMGAGNQGRYNATRTFQTFPFPGGLEPDRSVAELEESPNAISIASAAAHLNELRENWLNPADLVKRESEVVPGYPKRILPINEDAAQKLKKRTLTNLYNERPAWLQHAHKALDEAVAAAYGWPSDLPDDDILARLFALNQERASTQ